MVGQPPGRRLQECIALEKNTGEQAEVAVTQKVIRRKMASRNGKVTRSRKATAMRMKSQLVRSQRVLVV
jgi:hypothetical protein